MEWNTTGVGRFPAPREGWILQQLPEELMPFFGYRGEPIPDRFEHEVDYVYEIKYPDGGVYRKPILVHYSNGDGDGLPVFVINDKTELDGVGFTIVDWDAKTSMACDEAGKPFAYTHYEVTVTREATA